MKQSTQRRVNVDLIIPEIPTKWQIPLRPSGREAGRAQGGRETFSGKLDHGSCGSHKAQPQFTHFPRAHAAPDRIPANPIAALASRTSQRVGMIVPGSQTVARDRATAGRVLNSPCWQ